MLHAISHATLNKLPKNSLKQVNETSGQIIIFTKSLALRTSYKILTGTKRTWKTGGMVE
jgi:hypothetical protein